MMMLIVSLIIVASLSPTIGVYEHIRNVASFTSDKRPYFEPSTERNVSVVVGQTSHLNCTVWDLGDRTVSWIQKSTLHVLTSSVITFTGDSRFRCLHSAQSDSWTLQIKYTQQRDRGEYQCQVNTEPKISMSVFLHVTEARARIHDSDGGDKMVKKGSNIELNCTVESGDRAHSSLAVFWYLNNNVIDWQGQTGAGLGVQVVEKRGKVLETVLRITNVRLEHGGKYTCGPTTGISDTVMVHVIAGEQTEAIHVNSAEGSVSVLGLTLTVCLLILTQSQLS